MPGVVGKGLMYLLCGFNSKTLKELRNCILCIISVWSLFCSVQVYKSDYNANYVSLHYLPMILVKLAFVFLCFSFSCFCIFGFQFLALLYVLNSMSFQRLNSIEVNIVNHVLFHFVLTSFKQSVKI